MAGEIEAYCIEPNDIDSCFDQIVPGLLRVLQKATRPQVWSQYSVYHELKLGSSQLWVGFIDDKYAGFLVSTDGVESVSGANYKYVWIAYSHLQNAVALMLPVYEDIARQDDCKFIRFGTTRKGWEKTAIKAGFEIEEVRYVKAI